MEIAKRSSPLVQASRRRTTPETPSYAGGQRGTPGPKPGGRLTIELIPGKLVHYQRSAWTQQAADFLEDDGQALNMMEREARDSGIEAPVFL